MGHDIDSIRVLNMAAIELHFASAELRRAAAESVADRARLYNLADNLDASAARLLKMIPGGALPPGVPDPQGSSV